MGDNFWRQVEETGWPKHVLRVLNGILTVALLVEREGASVCVHCSDGWCVMSSSRVIPLVAF